MRTRPATRGNRNEKKVIELLPKELAEFTDYKPQRMDIEDIYALTLNKLPARYTQKGSVVLWEPVSTEMIRREIRNAIHVVMQNPIYG